MVLTIEASVTLSDALLIVVFWISEDDDKKGIEQRQTMILCGSHLWVSALITYAACI